MGTMDEDDDEDDSGDVIRRFLEHHPLYAACRIERRRRDDLKVPSYWPQSIMLACKQCRRETTWIRIDFASQGYPKVTAPFEFYEDNYVLRYTCVHCSTEHAGFWCSVVETGTVLCLRKQGQSPAWSIEPTPGIASALPPQALEFYRKGLICTSHNFGLGAVGYFRRVVEIVAGHLLDLVETHATELGDQATVDAIAKARDEHPSTERLKHAASLLPPMLRPGGSNPLAALYDSYSEGIHALNDEECLDVARTVQAGLDYLLPNLREQLTKAREYQAAITKAKRRKQ